MTIKSEPLKREFVDSKTNTTYPDININYSPEQVKDFLSNQYPHLINAKVEGPEVLSNKLRYTLVTTIGTKG